MEEVLFNGMNMFEQEFSDRMAALTEEQYAEAIKHIPRQMVWDNAIPDMPDDMLWNELIRRYCDNKDGIERVKEALTLPTSVLP